MYIYIYIYTYNYTIIISINIILFVLLLLSSLLLLLLLLLLSLLILLHPGVFPVGTPRGGGHEARIMSPQEYRATPCLPRNMNGKALGPFRALAASAGGQHREPARERENAAPSPATKVNPQTKSLECQGFDSSRFLILRGGIPRSLGHFPEI